MLAMTSSPQQQETEEGFIEANFTGSNLELTPIKDDLVLVDEDKSPQQSSGREELLEKIEAKRYAYLVAYLDIWDKLEPSMAHNYEADRKLCDLNQAFDDQLAALIDHYTNTRVAEAEKRADARAAEARYLELFLLADRIGLFKKRSKWVQNKYVNITYLQARLAILKTELGVANAALQSHLTKAKEEQGEA